MPPRQKAARLTVCALALALGFGASEARAQDSEDDGSVAAPIIVNIVGRCTLTIAGKSEPCRGVAYMVFPSSGRIDFTAITETAGWSFSGEEDDNDDGDYVLTLDSVLTPSASRLDADGECDMEVAAGKRTVNTLECQASTDQGELTLVASGMIALGDADDDEGH